MRFSITSVVLALVSSTALVAAAPSSGRNVVDLDSSLWKDRRGLDIELRKREGHEERRGLDIELRKRDEREERRGITVNLRDRGLDIELRREKRADDPVSSAVTNLGNGLTNSLSPVLTSLGLGSVADGLTDSDISVSGPNADGVAKVTIVGAGALDGIVLTVPVLASTGEVAGAPKYYKAE